MLRDELIAELAAWKGKFDDEVNKAAPGLLRENQDLKSKITLIQSILSYQKYKNEDCSRFNFIGRIRHKIADSMLKDINSIL